MPCSHGGFLFICGFIYILSRSCHILFLWCYSPCPLLARSPRSTASSILCLGEGLWILSILATTEPVWTLPWDFPKFMTELCANHRGQFHRPFILQPLKGLTLSYPLPISNRGILSLRLNQIPSILFPIPLFDLTEFQNLYRFLLAHFMPGYSFCSFCYHGVLSKCQVQSWLRVAACTLT